MYRDLPEFVAALERAGELRRVSARVSPLLEIAAITDRVSKSRAPYAPTAGAQRTDPRLHDRGGHALLFDNVHGSDVPLLINAMGSYRRMEMALGCSDGTSGAETGHFGRGFEAIASRIGELVKPEPPRSLRGALEKARQFAPLLRIGPKRLRRPGPCQQVVQTHADVDLRRLPIIRCWPLDGDLASVGYPAEINRGIPGVEDDEDIRGRYITLGGVHTIHADDAGDDRPSSHNIGMYRAQLLGRRTLAMHWHVHHDGAAHWRSWKRRGEPMPVAIALGGESVLPYAATCPLPPGISELLMAGFLHGSGIELCKASTVPLWVPANAEIVIEGYVSQEAGPIGYDPRSGDPLGPGAVFEGPFGDHTGFYSLPDRYPILEVTAITRRRDAIYPTTIVGLPPQEDYYLGKATERIMLPLLKTIVHDIEDYDLPMFGAFHNCASIKVSKQYPMQGRRLMHSVWGAGQMAWTKIVFIVDDDVDVHDAPAVLRAAAAHCRPDRDIERVRGPLDILDHAAPRLGTGMKIGFDATRRWPGEQVGGIGIDPGGNDAASPMTDGERHACLERAASVEGVLDVSLPDELGRGWLLVRIRKSAPGQGRAVIDQLRAMPECCRPPFVIVVGDEADVQNVDDALFHWCANSDASRDAVAFGAGDGRAPQLAFDATPKMQGDEANGEPIRDWPPLLQMEPDVDARIVERWTALGLEPVDTGRHRPQSRKNPDHRAPSHGQLTGHAHP